MDNSKIINHNIFSSALENGANYPTNAVTKVSGDACPAIAADQQHWYRQIVEAQESGFC